MAEHTMYHALGQGEVSDAHESDFRRPVAAYAEQGGAYNNAPVQQGNQQFYGGPSPSAVGGGGPPYASAQAPPGQGGYFPTQGQVDDTGLAPQMGNMTLGGEAGYGRRKKKDRHAYHAVEAPSVQGSNGIPSPAMNQFPSPANTPFNPVLVTPAEFAARPGAGAGAGDSLISPGVHAAGQSKVSPDEMPSVPHSRDSVQQYFLTNMYPTFERHVPPPSTISFAAVDQGNASPKFARLTMNNIPATVEGLKSTGLPLGLIVQPLAALSAGELAVPVLDFGDMGPPRCHRCRAYMNPFMMFRSGGNKFVCNLCGYANDTSPEYFCAVSPQGVRVDRDQRPELCRGTIEFVVPKEYCTRDAFGMRYLFLLDVTQESYNKGFLEAFCDGILGALYGGGEDGVEVPRRIPQEAKVGFVTYDKEIHFYNLSPALERAQMMIMPDIEDPFVPLSEGLFVDPYECRDIITSLLTRLPHMFSDIKNPEPALLSTLNSAVAALQNTGGKIFCSVAALSTWGPGRLFLRDDGKHVGGEPDKKLFTTDHPAWKKMGEKMVSTGVGVDFFMASGGYLDMATVGSVAATSGGETFFYPNFSSPRDKEKLSLELRHALTRETGYQALMKVRCSNGLQVSAYHGNFVHHTFGADLEMGVVDADKAIGVTFDYDGKLDAKLDAHFQAALLYTTASGQRRVRCINVIASVGEVVKDCVKFVDQDAVYTMLAKEAAGKLANSSASLKDVRLSLTERTIDVLACHRKNFLSQAHPPSQLVMPERLKEFAMYMLAMIKCRTFKGGSETTDRRVHDMRMMRCAGCQELSLYLYPRMIALHNLQPEDGFPDPVTGQLCMPPAVRASFARVEPGGVYLVDNGQQCLLWFHSQTSPNLIMDLFGQDKTDLRALDPFASSLPVLETHLNAQVRNIIEFLRPMRGSRALTVQLARQGIDGAEYEFARMLVEDRNNEAQSYVDWLVHMHKGVQLELSGQRKREDQETSTLSQFAGLRPGYW